MSDEIWQREEIDSPCVKVCLIHPDAEICIGCHRSRAEIAGWSRLNPDQRRAIMAELPARASQLRGKRRGRAAHHASTSNRTG